jgi:hypothetical protein
MRAVLEDRNPWLGVLFDAVTAETGTPVPPPGIPGPFSLEAPGALDELLAGAEFSDNNIREISTPMKDASWTASSATLLQSTSGGRWCHRWLGPVRGCWGRFPPR